MNDPYNRIILMIVTLSLGSAIFLIVILPQIYQNFFTPSIEITVTEILTSNKTTFMSDDAKFDGTTASISFSDSSGKKHTYSLETHEINLKMSPDQKINEPNKSIIEESDDDFFTSITITELKTGKTRTTLTNKIIVKEEDPNIIFYDCFDNIHIFPAEDYILSMNESGSKVCEPWIPFSN